MVVSSIVPLGCKLGHELGHEPYVLHLLPYVLHLLNLCKLYLNVIESIQTKKVM